MHTIYEVRRTLDMVGPVTETEFDGQRGTLYGTVDDVHDAVRLAERQHGLGYRSRVIEVRDDSRRCVWVPFVGRSSWR